MKHGEAGVFFIFLFFFLLSMSGMSPRRHRRQKKKSNQVVWNVNYSSVYNFAQKSFFFPEKSTLIYKT